MSTKTKLTTQAYIEIPQNSQLASQLPNLCMGASDTPIQYVIVSRLGAFFY